jgi:hypothetical protein
VAWFVAPTTPSAYVLCVVCCVLCVVCCVLCVVCCVLCVVCCVLCVVCCDTLTTPKLCVVTPKLCVVTTNNYVLRHTFLNSPVYHNVVHIVVHIVRPERSTWLHTVRQCSAVPGVYDYAPGCMVTGSRATGCRHMPQCSG